MILLLPPFLFPFSFSVHSYTKEAVELSAKLLEINPECYTAWNYRKLAVQHSLFESNLDPDAVNSILNDELRVVIFLSLKPQINFLFSV